MSDLVIEANDLSKHYGDVVAIDKLGFQVSKGEIVGLLGPNGAGKSTTMKILTCYTAPSSGTAKVNGCDVFEDPLAVRSGIGYLPESHALYTEMLVFEYLEFAAEMRGLKGDEARTAIKRAVEQAALGDVIAKEIRALSKGYRQRVGLAQALVHEPALLILDEPMSGLDPNQASEVRDVIRDIGKERTVILSTHNLAEVQTTCDRVLIISGGKIVADDTPRELAESQGKTRYTVALLDEGDAKEKGFKALEELAGVEVVRQLEGTNGDLRYELLPKGDDDLRPRIFKAAVDGGFTLVGLDRQEQNLEEIFRELTLGNKAN